MFREEFNQLFEMSDSVYDDDLVNYAKKVLLPNKNSIPRLYRFSNADYYSIRGLEKENLYLSPIGSMNDVFEGLPCNVSEKTIKHLDEIGEMAYIKSFSEDWTNLLMWAHYADNYRGICVEYDFSQASEELLYHLFPVYYSKKRYLHSYLDETLGEMYELKKDNDEHYSPNEVFFVKDILSLFLVKSQVWKYEKEWRIATTYPQLYNSSDEIDDDDNSCLYQLCDRIVSVERCIKAVYLGPRIAKEKKEHIMEICDSKLEKIPVHVLNLSDDEYMLKA